MKRRNLQRVEKVCFFKKSACSQSLSPLGHSVGFASCKAWCVLISASLPKTPSPWWKAVYALLALHLCNRGRLLSVRPAPTLFDHLYASLHRAFGRSISAFLPCLPLPSHWLLTIQRVYNLSTINRNPKLNFLANSLWMYYNISWGASKARMP